MSNSSRSDKRSLFDESLDHLQSALANWEAIDSKSSNNKDSQENPESQLVQKNQELLNKLKNQIQKLS